MEPTYFDRLREETPTRVWVNNPTAPEVDLALAHGADGCTTNPAYVANLLRRAPDEASATLAAVLARTAGLSDESQAELIQGELVRRLAVRFRPIHDRSNGIAGFVSLQGSPLRDEDAEAILDEARAARVIAPNVAPKIPATAAGLTAFEILVAEETPTIVTEVFSVAQFVETCDRYVRVVQRTGSRPRFFISPITGIFGDYLETVDPGAGATVQSAIRLAGVALARACHSLAVERGYPVRLLCGGARTPVDLTGLVGGDLSVTINWSTFAEVLAAGEGPRSAIDEPLDPAATNVLLRTFRDVERALRPDGLTVAEFADFGPVRHFRSIFEAGWNDLLAAIREHRVGSAVA